MAESLAFSVDILEIDKVVTMSRFELWIPSVVSDCTFNYATVHGIWALVVLGFFSGPGLRVSRVPIWFYSSDKQMQEIFNECLTFF